VDVEVDVDTMWKWIKWNNKKSSLKQYLSSYVFIPTLYNWDRGFGFIGVVEKL